MHEPPKRPAERSLTAEPESARLSPDTRQHLGQSLRAFYDGTAAPAEPRLANLIAQLDGAKRETP